MSNSEVHPGLNLTDTDFGTNADDIRLLKRLVRLARLLQHHDLDDLVLPNEQQRISGLRATRSGQEPHSLSSNADIEQEGDKTDRPDEDFDSDEDEDEFDYDGISETADDCISVRVVRPAPSANMRSSRARAGTSQSGDGRRPHAEVEKRYRSVLNSKIQQLNAFIPASLQFDQSLPTTLEDLPQSGTGEGQQPITKPIVLDRAHQYILHLVQTYEQYEVEKEELCRRLQQWLDV